MAEGDGVIASARAARRRRKDRRAVAQFQEFWTALQRVGDALSEVEKMSRRRSDTAWSHRKSRHWELATVQEIRGGLRGCRSSLRVMSNQAKRFEPQLILKDWSR
jgi:hypothetical protein